MPFIWTLAGRAQMEVSRDQRLQDVEHHGQFYDADHHRSLMLMVFIGGVCRSVWAARVAPVHSGPPSLLPAGNGREPAP